MSLTRFEQVGLLVAVVAVVLAAAITVVGGFAVIGVGVLNEAVAELLFVLITEPSWVLLGLVSAFTIFVEQAGDGE